MSLFRSLLIFIAFLLLVNASAAAEAPAELPNPVWTEQPAEPVLLEPEAPESFIHRFARGFSLHRQSYLLPLTWGNVAHSIEDAELIFQLSFKQRLGPTGFYLAYTQKSFWRIIDQENSRPFRETNYNPELFYRLTRPASWGSWGADLGIEHESNGAGEPDSRSWNRIYVAPFFEYRNFRADLKLWHRLSEDAKEFPEDPRGDENPEIVDFYGYGELRLAYEFPNAHMITLMTRWNFATDKGALQADYSLPTPAENLFWFAHLWTGYGESLIDYDRSITRYGIGLMFKR